MAYTNIDDPSAYFQTTTYAGDSNNSTVITNDGNSDLQADLIWLKNRTLSGDSTSSHMLFDSSRGIKSTTGADSPYLHSDSTLAEDTNVKGLQAVSSNGFTPGYMSRTNKTSSNFVAWQWKANGGTTTSVSASGTGANCINASTHQVNQDAGCSIITYTGRADQITVHQQTNLTHGLGVAQDLTIMKKRDGTGDWVVMGKHITTSSAYSANEHLHLNTTAAISDAEYTGYVAPTSTYIYLGDALVNDTGDDYVCYAFAEKQGYSKFGSYIANANTNGPFAYTGFKPAFLMIKNINRVEPWMMYDNKRTPINQIDTVLQANSNGADTTAATDYGTDFLSNGFKIRAVGTGYANHTVGNKYIYMAFAENPFTTSTGVPTTAR